MVTVEFNLLSAIEVHSVEHIRRILDDGVDARSMIGGKSLITHLTEMYYRSDQFQECLRLLLARGGQLDDPRLSAVLLDDPDSLAAELRRDPSLIEYRTSMVSAFTPLVGASLLHVAAEFGNLKAARVLVEMGADVNARAAVDTDGLNGQTPLFHTVNSNGNRSAPLMRLLLEAGAQVDVRLPGLTWGKDMPWETTVFDHRHHGSARGTPTSRPSRGVPRPSRPDTPIKSRPASHPTRLTIPIRFATPSHAASSNRVYPHGTRADARLTIVAVRIKPYSLDR